MAAPVNVVYTADVTQYNQSISDAMATTQQYATVVDNAAGRIAKAGITVTKAMTGFGPKNYRMSPAVQAAAGYEQSLSLLGARARISGQDIDKLGRNVRKLARDFPIGMGSSVEQYESLQRAGKSGEQLKKLTVEMTKLGAATGEMGTGLTEAMTQFSRSFGQFDAKGVSNLGDSVATLSSKFGTSATSMLEFSNTIAPLGKQMGMSATQVLGISTAFGRAGEDGYRAANVFNKMLSDMERSVRTGAPEIRTYAEAVGMTTEQFKVLAERDPTEAMTRFFEAINTSGNDSIRILEDIGLDGVRSYKAIAAVASQGGIREAIDEAQRAYGSTKGTQAAQEAFDGLNDSMTKVGESMNQLVDASAKPYAEVMGTVADATSKVTGKFAEASQSDLVQNMIQVGAVAGMVAMPMKALFSAGSFRQMAGMGMNAVKTPLAAVAASPAGQFGREHSGLLKGAGMAGLAVGGMMNSPLITMASIGAMLLGPGQTTVQKLGRRGGVALSSLWSGSQGVERIADLRAVDEDGKPRTTRGGRIYNLSRRLDEWSSQAKGMESAALRSSNAARDTIMGTYDRAHVWTESQRQMHDEEMKNSRQRIVDSDNESAKRRLLARRAVGGIAQTGLAGASMLSMLAPGLLPTLGIAAVAGVGAFAYSRHKATDEAVSDPSGLAKLASAAGLATKGMERFTVAMEAASKNATSAADAFKVTSEEVAMIENKDYESVFTGAKKGRNQEDILLSMIATGKNQDPNVQQRIVNDVAKLLGASTAEELGRKAFGPDSGKSAMQAAGEFAKNQMGSELNPFTTTWYYASGKRQETVDTMQSAADNMRASFEEDKKIYGEYTALSRLLDTGIEDVVKAAAAAPDKKVKAEALKGLSGLGDEEVTEILDKAEKLREAEGDEGRNPATGKQYTWEEAIEKYLKESDWYGETNKDKREAERNAVQIMPKLAEAGITGAGVLRDAIKVSTDQNMSLDKLLTQYDEYQALVDKQNAGGKLDEDEKEALKTKPYLTAAQASEVRSFINLESPKVKAENESKYYNTAANGIDVGAIVGNALKALEQQRQISGEPSPAEMQKVFEQYGGAMQFAQVAEGGSLSSGQARANRVNLQRGMLANVTSLEGGGILNEQGWIDTTKTAQFSKDPMEAEQQQAARNALLAEEQAVAKEQMSFLAADRQRQKQNRLQQIEFDISAANTRADAAKNERRQREALARSEARATEDFNRSKARQTDDFNKQQARSTEDFNKQMQRSEDDFRKQMTRGDDDFYRQRERASSDFYKQQGRAVEDFTRSMKRQGEEMARSMLNPMERIGASRVWSAGGLAANLKEQNEAVAKQLEVLQSLKDKGLSQDAIDLLGLAEAQNARQTIGLGGMTDQEIAALNEQAGTRMGLGEQINAEQVSYRQAYEDFNREMARQQEDFQLSLKRMDEDFALSRARAQEDFNLSTARANEDFQLSIQRAQEDFYLALQRADEDFTLQLRRQQEDLAISLQQMWEDVETTLDRQQAAMYRSQAAAREALHDMFRELSMSDEDRLRISAEAWDGEFNGYEDYMERRLVIGNEFVGQTSATAQAGLADTSGKAQGNIDTTAGKAQDSVADTASAAQSSLGETANTAAGTAREFSREAQSEIDDINEVASTGIDKINTALAKAKASIAEIAGKASETLTTMFDTFRSKMDTAFAKTVESLGNKLGEVPKTIKDRMKEFAWLLDEKNHLPNSEHVILIRTDEANFKKTWEKLAESGSAPGSAAGSGGAGAGVAYTPSAMLTNYATKFDRSVGKTKLDAPGWGTWDVYQHCLMNVQRIWLSLGNKTNGGFQPSAKAHASLPITKRSMQEGYAAPTGALYWWNVGRYGHVAVADGRGNAINNWGGRKIEKLKASSMSPGTYLGWTPPSVLGKGAVITSAKHIMAGEAGPEAVIPLDSRGAKFLTEVLSRYSAAEGVSASRTAGYGVSHTTNSTTIHNDSSVRTGNVTVVANDPSAFYEGLRRKTAHSRLASKV